MLQDSGAVPKEEGDIIRDYKATHFLSSWLKEVGQHKKERHMEDVDF